VETNWELISNFTIAMLAVVNPVEKIPLWVEASKGSRFRFQWLLASLVVVSCACVLLVFLWFGRQLLMELKIDLASFKIGGGLILLQFDFGMILIAIAVQFMVDGLVTVFPGWSRLG
jgi:multiple antibiotic resistance protein